MSIYAHNLLKGKVALITGGGSGIGKGMALSMMQHGANTVIVSRTLSKLNQAASDLANATNQQCIPMQADVRNYDDLNNVVQATLAHFKHIDIVVCGAAGNFLCPAERLSSRAFKSVVDIDLIGTFNTIKACLDPLKSSKGSIINISATLQYSGTPLQVHAASAKNGIDAMTRVLAAELGQFGIRVNAIAPGPIEGTEGVSRLIPNHLMTKYTNSIPLRRLGTIDDIANATLYLASDAASYVTGTILVVDGGSWMAQNSFMSLAWDEMDAALKNKKKAQL